jgi:Zn-dependent peptidase ImmA (M78 family)/transcriptional regulator with XRE-family HTH domain
MQRSDLRELGRRVQTCREQAHIAPGELARRARVQLDQLEAFEQGLGGLGMADVVSLAKVLGVPRSAFLHTSIPAPRAYEDPSVLLLNRATHSLQQVDRDALRDGLLRAERFVEAMAFLGEPRFREDPELFQLSPPGERPHESGYDRARYLRRRLADALPAQADLATPLRNVARLIEDELGILVVERPFRTASVQEASCRRGPARLIMVEPNQPETSRRWALAHGLAHHLLDLKEEDAQPDEFDERFSMEKHPREQRADAFAAMFLAPKEAIEAILQGRSLTHHSDARAAVEECRRRLGLNFIPMTRQLQDLALITRGLADTLIQSPTTDAVEGLEDLRLSDGLRRRVFAALDSDSISRGRARELDPDLALD